MPEFTTVVVLSTSDREFDVHLYGPMDDCVHPSLHLVMKGELDPPVYQFKYVEGFWEEFGVSDDEYYEPIAEEWGKGSRLEWEVMDMLNHHLPEGLSKQLQELL